jgi:hypothetical protein
MSFSSWRSVRRSTALTAVVAAGLLGTGFVGTASAAATTVTGTVKTAGGAGVSGAKVSIKVGTRTPVVATTNASGAFSANVQTGTASVTVTNPSTPAAGLPREWSVKNIATSIVSNGILNVALPATTPITARVSLAGAPVQGAAITQCSSDGDAADPTVVLAGSPAVAATQDFTGSTTNASGEVTLAVFQDTQFGRLCGAFSQVVGTTSTKYLARSGVKDTRLVSSMTLFIPGTVPQAGVVRDSSGSGKSDLKVALRSAGGQVDSTSTTGTAGAFSTVIAPGNVFARISGRSLSATVAPPTNVPRAFKATIDGASDGLSSWAVNLPATVTLSVKVVNSDGTPVKNAVIRPVTAGAYDAANPAQLVSGQPNAAISQVIYGDALSNDLGVTSARLFPDSSLGQFLVTKNIGGGLSRTATVAAGIALTTSTQITVVLPPA